MDPREETGQDDDSLATTPVDALTRNTSKAPTTVLDTTSTDTKEKTPSKPAMSASEPSVSSSVVITTNTVYIGNLPNQYATEAVIEKLLQPHGRVERVSLHQKNNRPFAFGQFSNIAQARKAMQALHGRKLAGRPLVVRPANSHSRTPAGLASCASQQQQQQTCPPRHQQKRQLESRIEAIKQQLKKKQQQND